MAGNPKIKGREEYLHDELMKRIAEKFFIEHPEIQPTHSDLAKLTEIIEDQLKTITIENPDISRACVKELFKTPNRLRADTRMVEFCYAASQFLNKRITKCTRDLTLYAMIFWFKSAVSADRCDADLLLAKFILTAEKNKCLSTAKAIKMIGILLPE